MLLVACEKAPPPAPPPTGLTLSRVDFAALPGWTEDPLTEALPAFERSCGKLSAISAGGGADERPVGPDGLAGTVADWRGLCRSLLVADRNDQVLRAAFEAAFVPFRVDPLDAEGKPTDGPGLFTGYYEPELRGARTADAIFRWPLYRPPDDLITANLGDFSSDLKGRRIVGRIADGRFRPYPGRDEIDGGLLAGRGLELLWLDDPIDRFFLHVQGSGRVLLAEGGATRVGFAATNDRTFFPIGRALIDEGKVSRNRASMQEIRDWLRAQPGEAEAMMARNARYTFFRELDGEGPVGAQGVVLTAGRSLAVDDSLLPLGAPLWLDTTWPGSERPLRRLVVAQDVGGAIKGPVRGDLYWGTGEAALHHAGRMKQPGSYYLLLPRAVADRRAAGSAASP
ncbi:MAG: murein transglycosylase A [Kiloniellales bacterium]